MMTVCACACVYVGPMHVCKYACMRARAHVHICACIHICLHACKYTCMHAHAFVYVCEYVFIFCNVT